MASELADAIRASADRLGISPHDFATAISYESGFRPDVWGGKNGNYYGLIQMGPEERAKYGVKQGTPAVEQVSAAESFLRDRGLKPGMGLLDLYSTINAGRPGLYNRSDAANGGAPGTVADKVAGMAAHRLRAQALLGGGGAAPAGAPAAAAGGVPPFALAPAVEDGGSGAAGLLAALQGVTQSAMQPNEPMPMMAPIKINFPIPHGLDRRRAMARAAARGQA